MGFWRKSLFARLISYFLLLAVIPLAIVGLIAYYQGQQALRDNVLNHLTTTATLKEDEINRWVESMKLDVQLLAQVPAVQEGAVQLLALDQESDEFLAAYEALHVYLKSMVAGKPDFMEILLLKGVGGQVVLATNPEHEGGYEVTSSFFTEGRKGLYVQSIYPSATLNKPAMTVSLPVKAEGGEVLGVMAVHLNLDRLDAIMLERGGLGATGETYLVDKFNVFISEAKAGGESFPRGVHTVGIDKALLDQADGSGVYTNYQGVPVLGAYRWLKDQGVALLAEMEQGEALAPVRRMAWALLVEGIVVAALVAMVAYLVTRQIARPISRLTQVATQMAAGDLSQRAAVKQSDEIGALGKAFDGMANQLTESISTLEQRVVDRTRDLEQRAVQLTTVAEVGRAATSTLDPEKLAQETVDLLRERFDLYYAGLFLVDERSEYAVLEAGTGEPGRTMKEQGHKLLVGGTSMVGAVCAERKAHIALDTGAEAVRFANPLLPETRSEMALPLAVGGRVLGALDVQSTRPAAFSEEDIAVMQLAADQVAVAVDNARKFSSEAALLEAASPLFAVSRRLAEVVTTDQAAQAIIDSVALTEADGCAVARFDFSPDDEVATITFLGSWSRSGASRFPVGSPLPASASMLPVSMMDRFWAVADVLEEAQMPANMRQALAELGTRAVVSVPLQAGPASPEGDLRERSGTGGRVTGAVIVQRAVPGPFSPVSLRLYETLAEQAAVVLERARLVEETQRRAAQERWLSQVSDQMQRAGDMGSLLQVVAEEVNRALGGSRAYVQLGQRADGDTQHGAPGGDGNAS